jgi:hypothetical protein
VLPFGFVNLGSVQEEPVVPENSPRPVRTNRVPLVTVGTLAQALHQRKRCDLCSVLVVILASTLTYNLSNIDVVTDLGCTGARRAF